MRISLLKSINKYALAAMFVAGFALCAPVYAQMIDAPQTSDSANGGSNFNSNTPSSREPPTVPSVPREPMPPWFKALIPPARSALTTWLTWKLC